jgi:hypothetical protein
LFESADSLKYLSWKIPLSEARDLSHWWETETLALQERSLPVKSVRFGSILISMYAPSLVFVKAFDVHGSPRIVGWTLPAPAVEALRHYFAANEKPNGPSAGSNGGEGGFLPDNSVQYANSYRSSVRERIGVSFLGKDPRKRRNA